MEGERSINQLIMTLKKQCSSGRDKTRSWGMEDRGRCIQGSLKQEMLRGRTELAEVEGQLRESGRCPER